MKGVELARRAYRQFAPNPLWAHDHCEFCGVKFTIGEGGDALHEGYCTLDEYRWVCAGCFDDFREHFEWKLVDADGVAV